MYPVEVPLGCLQFLSVVARESNKVCNSLMRAKNMPWRRPRICLQDSQLILCCVSKNDQGVGLPTILRLRLISLDGGMEFVIPILW